MNARLSRLAATTTLVAWFGIPATSTLTAQIQPRVTPTDYATTRGNRLGTYPLGQWAQGTYQQVHGDLRGPARPITRLSFRIGVPTVQSTAHTVEMEMRIGEANYSQRSANFAANYTNTPTQVLRRKAVAFPDWTKLPAGGLPGPFNATITFDTPFVYTGTTDLTWTMRVLNNSTSNPNGQANTYAVDAFRSRVLSSSSGTDIGAACLPTQRFTIMRCVSMVFARWKPRPTYEFGIGYNFGPRGVPSIGFLGLSDPNLAVPGLCANLRVGGIFLTTSGFSDGRGSYVSNIVVPYDPTWVGIPLYSQAAGAETRPGIPWTLSKGRRFTMPALPPKPIEIATIWQPQDAGAIRGMLYQHEGAVIELR